MACVDDGGSLLTEFRSVLLFVSVLTLVPVAFLACEFDAAELEAASALLAAVDAGVIGLLVLLLPVGRGAGALLPVEDLLALDGVCLLAAAEAEALEALGVCGYDALLLLSRDDALQTLLPELGTALDVRELVPLTGVTAPPTGGFRATGALMSTGGAEALLRVDEVGLNTDVGVVDRGVIVPPALRLTAVGVVGRGALVGVVDLFSDTLPNDDRTPAVRVVDRCGLEVGVVDLAAAYDAVGA